MENPIKMDDLGVPLFSETSICLGVCGKPVGGNSHILLILTPNPGEIDPKFDSYFF